VWTSAESAEETVLRVPKICITGEKRVPDVRCPVVEVNYNISRYYYTNSLSWFAKCSFHTYIIIIIGVITLQWIANSRERLFPISKKPAKRLHSWKCWFKIQQSTDSLKRLISHWPWSNNVNVCFGFTKVQKVTLFSNWRLVKRFFFFSIPL